MLFGKSDPLQNIVSCRIMKQKHFLKSTLNIKGSFRRKLMLKSEAIQTEEEASTTRRTVMGPSSCSALHPRPKALLLEPAPSG